MFVLLVQVQTALPTLSLHVFLYLMNPYLRARFVSTTVAPLEKTEKLVAL